MARGIAGISVAVGHGQDVGGSRLGPDEDEFTLAVEALEGLQSSPDLPAGPGPRMVVLGSAGLIEDWMLAEATGWGDLKSERLGGSVSDLGAALARAIGRPDDGVEEVLLVLPGVAKGSARTSGAMGFRFTRDGGLFLDRLSEPTAPSSGPVVWTAFAKSLQAVRRWADSAHPGDRSNWTFDGSGAGSLSAQVTIRGPVDWGGTWGDRPSHDVPSGPSSSSATGAEPIDGVSQGAYVPWATYRENLPSRWRLVGTRCLKCQRINFPRHGACRGCGESEGLEPVVLPRNTLRVVASTVIQPGAQPTEFDDLVKANGGYGVVLVELAPGVRGTFQVTDHPAVPVPLGSTVDTRLRRLYGMEGRWRYGRKAVPRSEVT